MPDPRSSSSADISADEELRLPRPPGVIRRFWARHPRLGDALIALICVLLSLGANATFPDTAEPISVGEGVFLSIVIVGASALLMWRRRRPEIVLVAAIIVELLLLTITGSTGAPMLPVAVYSLAVYRSTRACWIGLGISVLLVAALAYGLLPGGAITVQQAINAGLATAIPGLIGALIGINVGNRKRYLEAIIDRSRQLLVERDQQAQLAAAAERDRIAREMHDIVSHSLTVVVALSEGAAATDDRRRAREASTAAAATARNALTEMRSMLGVLRDGDSDTPLAPLRATDPDETVAAARRAGFEASLAVRGRAPETPALRLAIGRIVQEGVTNAMRHAPTTKLIDVRIDYDASPIVLEVVNDGVTGSPSQGGFGLRGLTERASLLGGTLVSAPAGAGRWMLRAELPRTELAPGAGEGGPVSPPLPSDAAPSHSRDSAGAATTSRGGDEREPTPVPEPESQTPEDAP
ncbi:sensor histidine kinase [Microbacterium alcoholitolerans]|uniref:sensor histidine kinase n=1 Tax=unclassified Microbacterium TaxID=2609290 RepID=UPI003D16AF2A